MVKKETAKQIGRSLYPAVISCALLVPSTLLFSAWSCVASEFSDTTLYSRRYSLSGYLELSYERQSSQGAGGAAGNFSDFRQLLQLEHRGFVQDPSLVSYQVSGTVSHDAGSGIENSTLAAEQVGLTLFRSLPGGLKNKSDFIPHPIWLRFSREDSSDSSEYMNYGFSLVHRVSPKQRYLVTEEAPKADEKDADLYEDGPSRITKIVEKDRSFPIPTTFLDFDHYDQKYAGSHTANDILSLRSSLSGKTYEYRLLYENQNMSGSQEIRRNTIQLEPLYRFYDEGTRGQLTIANLLRYEEIDPASSVEANSTLTWTRPIGKDGLMVTSDLGYSSSSAPSLATAQYRGGASGLYTKNLSATLTNKTLLWARFTKNDTDNKLASSTVSQSLENYFGRLSDTVTADLTRVFRGTASAFVGDSDQGIEYGTSATLLTKTRIVASVGYSYSLTSSLEQAAVNTTQQTTIPEAQQVVNGKSSRHDLSFGLSGPILNNLMFQTNADFILADVPVASGTSRQETNTVSGNLVWRLFRTKLSLGGNYTQSKTVDTQTSATSSTSLYATLTRVLPMRTLLNLYSTWTRSVSTGVSNIDTTTLEVRPTLRWTRGMTTVDAEYSYRSSWGSGGNGSTVDNRIFVRLVRRFSALF